ncbi:ABC transporter ATP-binding protein [Streptomyces vilmorinianum]|uniref:ABC transporter ATP-binding protein n=1 Tax=Streptomyces vilmorinianum TaxID=3051092 RepID=UPI0015867784|nr:ABC transporter ATP-binding protein [Streptomyces vilmorinianum]
MSDGTRAAGPPRTGRGADEPAIALHGLTKRYGSVVGIETLSLTVGAGEVFGFLGPNGAGKTTTLRCLTGLLRPTAGQVRVLGLDPVADHPRLAPALGYLPGELRLYPELTGAQTLDLLTALQGAPSPRRGELCARLELSDRDLRRPVQGYSRGMKQKLGLVQALQHDPRLVVLDEPTEGLDPLVQETFYELMAEAAGAGRTVLLSSHVLPEVQRACGRVAIVREGRLVTVERVAALREARARRIRVTLEGDDRGGRPRSLGHADRWSPRWEGDRAELLVPPSEVIATLRGLLALPVVDITVEEAGLDEAFLDLYRARDPAPSRARDPAPDPDPAPGEPP